MWSGLRVEESGVGGVQTTQGRVEGCGGPHRRLLSLWTVTPEVWQKPFTNLEGVWLGIVFLYYQEFETVWKVFPNESDFITVSGFSQFKPPTWITINLLLYLFVSVFRLCGRVEDTRLRPQITRVISSWTAVWDTPDSKPKSRLWGEHRSPRDIYNIDRWPTHQGLVFYLYVPGYDKHILCPD